MITDGFYSMTYTHMGHRQTRKVVVERGYFRFADEAGNALPMTAPVSVAVAIETAGAVFTSMSTTNRKPIAQCNRCARVFTQSSWTGNEGKCIYCGGAELTLGVASVTTVSGTQECDSLPKLSDFIGICKDNPIRLGPSGTEARVCEDIAERQALGINKYGKTVEQNPLKLREWLQHAYEETLDQAIYLKRAMEEMDGN